VDAVNDVPNAYLVQQGEGEGAGCDGLNVQVKGPHPTHFYSSQTAAMRTTRSESPPISDDAYASAAVDREGMGGGGGVTHEAETAG
jgi:hypothetical protein